MIKKVIEKFSPFNFVMLFIAGIINAFGVTMFLAPVNLYDSGLSGTSMLLWELTPDNFTLGLFLIVLNIPFFIFGLKKQGVVFTVYSIFAVAIYALASFFFTDIMPIDISVSSPFAGTDLVLCAVFGGMISGIGSGTTIRYGGAIDGIEVVSVIFAKRLGLTVGSFVMIYNVILYISVGIIMNSWILPLYSIITYAVAVKTIDFIVEGFDKAKSAMIITELPDEISAELSESFGKGVTMINAHGYYSDEAKTMIYFVVNRFQIAKLKRIVRTIDKKAFITITEVSDVLGTSAK